VIISLIWLEADSPLVSVTPRILRVVTRTMPGIGNEPVHQCGHTQVYTYIHVA